MLLIQKRAAQVESWVDACSDDGRVHGSVISTGAITGRMTHRNPNMAQFPAYIQSMVRNVEDVGLCENLQTCRYRCKSIRIKTTSTLYG